MQSPCKAHRVVSHRGLGHGLLPLLCSILLVCSQVQTVSAEWHRRRPRGAMLKHRRLRMAKDKLQFSSTGKIVSARRKRAKKVISVAVLSAGHGADGCAANCTANGVCNMELGRCDCPRGFKGRDCSERYSDKEMTRICKDTHFYRYTGNCTDNAAIPDQIVCINGCNGRGACRAGWCHCKPGYWGADCSLSMNADGKVEILQGQGYKERQKRPWIYIYDLPPRLTTWRNPHHTDRPLHISFWHRLLGSGAITADPEQADFFFFPMSVRGPGDGKLVESAVHYVRTYWPYWDKYSGARHIIIHTGDTGRSELTGMTQALVKNVTFLTHWGLYEKDRLAGWPASHILNHDIVLPIHMAPLGHRSSGLQLSPLHPLSAFERSAVKDIQLLFAGRICGGREEPDATKPENCRPINKGYSQGVRQLIHQHHWNRTGFRIGTRNPTYFTDLTRTRFCLAPSGGGHGHRQILVAFSGCTPLVISDHVLQPFEPALNWTRFSVTLPQSSIPELHTILPQVSEQQYNEMQAALSCAAQHFSWSTFTGSFMRESGKYDAFETTMEILRMMIKYPGVPHAQFESIDPEFKAFMECRSDEHSGAQTNTASTNTLQGSSALQNGVQDTQQDRSATRALFKSRKAAPAPAALAGSRVEQTGPLCSLSQWDGATCEQCLTTHKRMVPGGVLCCNHVDNLATCPRLWA